MTKGELCDVITQVYITFIIHSVIPLAYITNHVTYDPNNNVRNRTTTIQIKQLMQTDTSCLMSHSCTDIMTETCLWLLIGFNHWLDDSPINGWYNAGYCIANPLECTRLGII